MTLQKTRRTIQQCFEAAAAAEERWPGNVRRSYGEMLEVGFRLLEAKEKCPDLVKDPDYPDDIIKMKSATWDLHLKKYLPKKRPIEADANVELSRDALGWVADMHPQVTDRAKMEEIARVIMILSPR